MEARTGIHLLRTLVFVESDERFSVYRNKHDGTYVYLAHGTGAQLVDIKELDLVTLWAEFTRIHAAWNTGIFNDLLRDLLIEPEQVDGEVSYCGDCGHPIMGDERCSTNDGSVCEECYDQYSICHDCEESFKWVTSTLNGTNVCERCRDNNWSWCEHCDGYYHDDDHDHDPNYRDCECEAPGQSFYLRNDGDPLLANDTRATITLPAGEISDEGIGEICIYLRDHSYSLDEAQRLQLHDIAHRLGDLGNKWQTKQGNFTKRLSRFAYKEHGLKLAPEVVSKVGCIARDHSASIDFEIEVTRDVNGRASEFGHSGSCWWTDYAASRCALKSNGGFALRTFNGGGVSGRAWVMPMRQTEGGSLTPTFDTDADAFVVFNGYGDLSGYVGTRIMSHMLGMTYRKIEFASEPMYVNNESGYLVAPEEIASTYTDGHLRLSLDAHANVHDNERSMTNA